MYVYMYACMYACMYVYIYMCVCVHLQAAGIHVRIYIYIHMHTHIYTCTWICVYKIVYCSTMYYTNIIILHMSEIIWARLPIPVCIFMYGTFDLVLCELKDFKQRLP